jgi:tripartite-type tricarboxylate transporter receptor subunit TctC
MRTARLALCAAAAISGVLLATAAWAQDVESFFKGKTIDLIISTGVGGGLDTNARIVAKHMQPHIPGKPTIVPKNMPGAGHVRAANYLATQAAKDGTVMGTLIPAFVTAQVLNRTSAIQFDAEEFAWLGSTASSNSTIYVATSTGVKTMDDARRIEVTMGGTGAGSYTTLLPIVMNNVFGTKFKVISGYQSTADVGLAMERGEVQGRAGNNFNSIKSENPALLRDKKIVILAQFGVERDPEFPDVPLATDLARNEDERQIMKVVSADVPLGRPFLLPPGVPKDRIDAMRKAFEAMVRDPAYLAAAAKANIEVAPLAGEKLQAIVEDLVATPAPIVERARKAMEMPDAAAAPKSGK